jgi:hypothetical protein
MVGCFDHVRLEVVTFGLLKEGIAMMTGFLRIVSC